jgi:SOS-response transcriptional repressor LexA
MAKKYPKLGTILKKLLFRKDIRAADLARNINIPAPTIHRLITGKSTRPYLSSLQPIADYFSLNVQQLLGEEALPAEYTETNEEGNNLPRINKIKYLPIIPWEQIFSVDKIQYKSFKQTPFIGSISEQSFATTMPDSSMEPIFPQGSILIFDPQKTPKDRSYVLVQISDSQLPTFRQLLIDLEYKYLKPLNPDLKTFKMRLLEKKDVIHATLVEARKIYENL